MGTQRWSSSLAQGSSMRASQVRVEVTHFSILKRLYLCTYDFFEFEKEFWEREAKATILRFAGSFYESVQ